MSKLAEIGTVLKYIFQIIVALAAITFLVGFIMAGGDFKELARMAIDIIHEIKG